MSMAQFIIVDEAAILHNLSFILGHRKHIELDLGHLTILQDIRLDIVELILGECLTDAWYVDVVADLELIRLALQVERYHTPVHAVTSITLGRILLRDVCESTENTLAGSRLLASSMGAGGQGLAFTYYSSRHYFRNAEFLSLGKDGSAIEISTALAPGRYHSKASLALRDVMHEILM